MKALRVLPMPLTLVKRLPATQKFLGVTLKVTFFESFGKILTKKSTKTVRSRKQKISFSDARSHFYPTLTL